MTIRYLEIFVEVCKQMNMSKAAQSLMISQSSVSRLPRWKKSMGPYFLSA